MAYASNVLPRDAVYYRLTNASISNGILTFGQNGSASIDIDTTLLSSIPASILFNMCTTTGVDRYTPEVEIRLTAVMKDGSTQAATVYHTGDADEIIAVYLGLEEGEYTRCTLTIASAVSCSLILWEMCPLQETDVTTIIEGVEQSLPKLLSDYNIRALTVGQEQTTVGLIACSLLANTDLQGHFLFTFTASEYCNVIIRMLDNEMTELFCPLTYTVQPGLNSLGVPHAFLSRLAGYHSIAVTVQCTAGVLAVPVRGVLFTIDGGYLAERLVNAGIDATDITLHQSTIDGPDEVWLIGVDANTTTLRSRKYKDPAGVAWTPQYAFANSVASAIEFDGDWVQRGDTAYTLITDSWPLAALVDTQGVLRIWAYDAVSFTYKVQATLATNVTKVSLCKGFSSVAYREQDQGLICAYLKSDGTAWYTHYSYVAASDAYLWHPSVKLTAVTDVTHISVNRLNDYRVGILCSTAEGAKWFITSRTYVGQAVRGELAEVSVNMHHTLFYMGPNIERVTSATALELPESIAVAPQILYGTYIGPITFTPGVATKEFFTVYVNGEEYTDFLVYVDGADVGIDLNKSTLGMKNIRVVFNNSSKDAIIDMSGNGHGWYADSYDFTWTPVITYHVDNLEATSISASVDATIAYHPIVELEGSATEAANVSVSVDASIAYKPIVDTELEPVHESATIEASVQATITQRQTGDKPI